MYQIWMKVEWGIRVGCWDVSESYPVGRMYHPPEQAVGLCHCQELSRGEQHIHASCTFHSYKYKYKFTNTNLQIQIYKYKYKFTNTKSRAGGSSTSAHAVLFIEPTLSGLNKLKYQRSILLFLFCRRHKSYSNPLLFFLSINCGIPKGTPPMKKDIFLAQKKTFFHGRCFLIVSCDLMLPGAAEQKVWIHFVKLMWGREGGGSACSLWEEGTRHPWGRFVDFKRLFGNNYLCWFHLF